MDIGLRKRDVSKVISRFSTRQWFDSLRWGSLRFGEGQV